MTDDLVSVHGAAEYGVRWVIDVSAPDPVEAARKALRIQRDPSSQATVFMVTELGDYGAQWRVDLDDRENNAELLRTRETARLIRRNRPGHDYLPPADEHRRLPGERRTEHLSLAEKAIHVRNFCATLSCPAHAVIDPAEDITATGPLAFYLGSHRPNWLWDPAADFPLCLSLESLHLWETA